MNVSNIFSVSFNEIFISKLNNLGFSFEIEIDRLMFGHYVFQHKNSQDIVTTIWLGIDWKGQLVFDTVVQDLLGISKPQEKNYWVRNTSLVLPILNDLESYILKVKDGETNVFDFINDFPKDVENYEGADQWIEKVFTNRY